MQSDRLIVSREASQKQRIGENIMLSGRTLPVPELKKIFTEIAGLNIADSINGEPPFFVSGSADAFESLKRRLKDTGWKTAPEVAYTQSGP